MTVTLFVHFLNIPHQLHSVVATVIQPAHKRRNVDGFSAAFSGRIDGRSLGLRKTERYIHANVSRYRHVGCSKALSYAGILYISVGNPGEHVFALGQHLLGGSIKVGKNLDGDTSRTHQRRNGLDDLFCTPVSAHPETADGQRRLGAARLGSWLQTLDWLSV